MSGHSKWSQIKRKKEAKDVQKGKIFSKLFRLITVAVKEGGGITDPEKNVKLRLAVEKAKEYNMPKENIQRAIERAKGGGDQELKEVIYEAFGPGGVCLIILATTDNSNRTLSEIRQILHRNGGKLGTAGATSFLFEKCGLAIFDKTSTKEDEVLDFAERVGALDIEEDQESFFVYLPFEKIGYAHQCLSQLKSKSLEVDYRPKSVIEIKDKETAEKVLFLIEALESLEDVQKVYANFEIPDQFLNEKKG